MFHAGTETYLGISVSLSCIRMKFGLILRRIAFLRRPLSCARVFDALSLKKNIRRAHI